MSGSLPLIIHIATGALALAAGTAAFSVRKGSVSHRRSGRVFVAMMAVMALTGTYLALSMGVMLSVIGGLLTLYLVATAWAVVARKSGKPGILEAAALASALFIGSLSLFSGWEATASETGLKDGFPAGQYFLFGSVALLAAGGDVRVLLTGGLARSQRLARHLWRMSVAFVIASSAFFLGQIQLFPAAIVEFRVLYVPVLYLPVLLPFLLMLYWLVQTLWPRRLAEEALDAMDAVKHPRRFGPARKVG